VAIGDLVVRAYAWESYVIGIIVDIVHVSEPSTQDPKVLYEETSCTVAWSDGNISSEMDCELEWIKDGASQYDYAIEQKVNEE
tara:strand:+ start:269 stop:517 length:249 start_codon:yes stop_codon:yes gene_type:complete